MKALKDLPPNEQSDLIRRLLARVDEMADDQQKLKERLDQLEGKKPAA